MGHQDMGRVKVVWVRLEDESTKVMENLKQYDKWYRRI